MGKVGKIVEITDNEESGCFIKDNVKNIETIENVDNLEEGRNFNVNWKFNQNFRFYFKHDCTKKEK